MTGLSRLIIVDSPDEKKQLKLFEARKLRETTVISEIDGIVKDDGAWRRPSGLPMDRT